MNTTNKVRTCHEEQSILEYLDNIQEERSYNIMSDQDFLQSDLYKAYEDSRLMEAFAY